MGLAAAPGCRRRLPGALAAVVAVALAGGCSSPALENPPQPPDPAAGTAPSATVVIEPPRARPGEPLPAPAGPPILTVTGRISSSNVGGALRLDAATLDRLGRLKVSVYEPWVKQVLEFQGVWLADLLEAAGIEGTASSIHMTALDDYQIDLTVPEVMAGGILLATRTGDGDSIPVEDGGPTRVVFVGDVPSGSSAENWIWSLSTIDVR